MKQVSSDGLKITTRIAMLKPGMHVFRYASRFPDSQKVLLTLQLAPLGKGTADFFPGDGVSRNTLGRFGDCMVVRVKGDYAGILVAEYHLESVGATGPVVDLRIDFIDTENFLQKDRPEAEFSGLPNLVSPPEVTPPPPPVAPAGDLWPAMAAVAKVNAAPTSSFEPLELVGHVERRGDVRVSEGWLGDPASSARIEGFAVEWKNRPADVDLVYTCRVEGIGQTPVIYSGNYAGTRQRAAPITALSFALAGSKAADFILSGQVVFAGCPPLAITPGQKLSGPKGSEQLVALRVFIARQGGETATSRSPSTSPWDDPRITQIFRANRP